MANKQKIDTEAFFKNITKAEEKEQEVKAEKNIIEKAPSVDEQLIQKAYYITKKQYKALKMKSAVDDMDMSEIVRNALNLYLEL